MHRTVCLLILGSLLLLAPGSFAATLTFDTLPDPGFSAFPVPNGYGGLTWSNFEYLNAVNEEQLTPNGYTNNMISSPMVAFNGFGSPSSFSSATPFTLTSAWFGAAWNDGLQITVTGLLNGQVLDTKTFLANAEGPPVFVNFNWSGINEVDFSSTGGTPVPGYNGQGTQFVLDNLTINGGGNVPEPASLFLLGSGLISMKFFVSRNRK